MLTIPPTGPIPDKPLLIGDVAELTGLSLSSIRHYEELGLAVADSRTSGGFRVFGAEAVERLRLAMILRAMNLSLEEIIPIVDACRAAERGVQTEDRGTVLAEAQTRVREAQSAFAARLTLAKELVERLQTAGARPADSRAGGSS